MNRKNLAVTLGLLFSTMVSAADISVYVYSDKGVCESDCAEAAADVARRFKIEPTFIEKKDLTPEFFKELNPLKTIWIQPGGDAIVLAKYLTDQQTTAIRNLISNGAGYLGFCAGGFYTDKWVDNENTIHGLDILPGSSHDFNTPEKQMVLPITWENGITRYMYFEEGGYFEFNPSTVNRVFARYANGAIAIASFPFGKGRVAISGPHPEAPLDWLVKKKLTPPSPKPRAVLTDPDGVDWAYADLLFEAVLPK